MRPIQTVRDSLVSIEGNGRLKESTCSVRNSWRQNGGRVSQIRGRLYLSQSSETVITHVCSDTGYGVSLYYTPQQYHSHDDLHQFYQWKQLKLRWNVSRWLFNITSDISRREITTLFLLFFINCHLMTPRRDYNYLILLYKGNFRRL